MKILIVTDNLMTRSWLEPACRQAGAEVLPRGGADEPDLVAVDLTAREAAARLARLREAWPHARLLAFGPHVDGAAFAEARAAGAHEAVARGRALQRLLALLAEGGQK